MSNRQTTLIVWMASFIFFAILFGIKAIVFLIIGFIFGFMHRSLK
jgi:hypothetical protein